MSEIETVNRRITPRKSGKFANCRIVFPLQAAPDFRAIYCIDSLGQAYWEHSNTDGWHSLIDYNTDIVVNQIDEPGFNDTYWRICTPISSQGLGISVESMVELFDKEFKYRLSPPAGEGNFEDDKYMFLSPSEIHQTALPRDIWLFTRNGIVGLNDVEQLTIEKLLSKHATSDRTLILHPSVTVPSDMNFHRILQTHSHDAFLKVWYLLGYPIKTELAIPWQITQNTPGFPFIRIERADLEYLMMYGAEITGSTLTLERIWAAAELTGTETTVWIPRIKISRAKTELKVYFEDGPVVKLIKEYLNQSPVFPPIKKLAEHVIKHTHITRSNLDFLLAELPWISVANGIVRYWIQ